MSEGHWYNSETGQVECECCSRAALAGREAADKLATAEATIASERRSADRWTTRWVEEVKLREQQAATHAEMVKALERSHETVLGLFAEVDQFQNIIMKNEPLWVGSGYSPALCMRLAEELRTFRYLMRELRAERDALLAKVKELEGTP